MARNCKIFNQGIWVNQRNSGCGKCRLGCVWNAFLNPVRPCAVSCRQQVKRKPAQPDATGQVHRISRSPPERSQRPQHAFAAPSTSSLLQLANGFHQLHLGCRATGQLTGSEHPAQILHKQRVGCLGLVPGWPCPLSSTAKAKASFRSSTRR